MKNLYLMLFLILSGCHFSDSKNYLTIKNDGSDTLSEVRIEFANSDQFYLGKLYPGSEYKFKLFKTANENAIYVLYRNGDKKIQKELAIPYLVLAENKNYEYSIR